MIVWSKAAPTPCIILRTNDITRNKCLLFRKEISPNQHVQQPSINKDIINKSFFPINLISFGAAAIKRKLLKAKDEKITPIIDSPMSRSFASKG